MPGGSSMKVEIMFRTDSLEQRGYLLEYTKQVVQQTFEQAGLRCTEEPVG